MKRLGAGLEIGLMGGLSAAKTLSVPARRRVLPIGFLTHGVGLAWCLALALLWDHEEPNKARTLLVFFCVYTLAALILRWAWQKQIIHSPRSWMLAFLLKLTVSFLITRLFWVAPLDPDLMRVPYGRLALQDSNIYDYEAIIISDYGFFNWGAPVSYTWQSFGIGRYLAAIYSIFGVSILYVSLFNSLLSLSACLALTGTMVLLDKPRKGWQLLRFGMLIPHVAYFDATPAKEPLTNAFLYLSIYFLAKLTLSKGVSASTLLAGLASLFGLAMVRANAAVLLLIGFTTSLIWTRRIAHFRTLFLVLCGVIFVGVGVESATGGKAVAWLAVLDPGVQLELVRQNLLERGTYGDDPLKMEVGWLLLPTNISNLVLLSPVRAIVWLLLPYPLIVPDFYEVAAMPVTLYTNRLAYFGLASYLFSVGSTWLIMIAAPYIVSGLLDKASRRMTGFRVIFTYSFVFAMVVGNVMFVMGRRYRTVLELLLMALAIWGFYHGKPERFRLPTYLLLGGGLGAYMWLGLMRS